MLSGCLCPGNYHAWYGSEAGGFLYWEHHSASMRYESPRLLLWVGVRDRDGYSGTQIVTYTETRGLYLVSSYFALSARGSELGNVQHLKVSSMYS